MLDFLKNYSAVVETTNVIFLRCFRFQCGIFRYVLPTEIPSLLALPNSVVYEIDI